MRPTAAGSDRDVVVAARLRTRRSSRARRTRAIAALLAWPKGERHLRRIEEAPPDSLADRVTRETIWRLVTPRWRRHLERLIEDERPDAVIVFTVPMAHFRGIPSALRERFGIPIFFYDGDVPMSLPEFGGMDTPRLQLLPRRRPGGVRRCGDSRTRRGAAAGCSSSAHARRKPCSGVPILSSSLPSRCRRRPTSSSTATATSSAASGWRRSWASRRVLCPLSTSHSAATTSAATRARRGCSGTFPSRLFRARSPRPGSTFVSPGGRTRRCTPRRRAEGRSSSSRRRRGDRRGAPTTGSSAGSSRGASCSSPPTPPRRSTPTGRFLDDPAAAEELGRRARERVLDEHTYRHRARRLLEVIGFVVGARVG